MLCCSNLDEVSYGKESDFTENESKVSSIPEGSYAVHNG